jgi:hypothetical protein
MEPNFAEYCRFGIKEIRHLTINGKAVTTAEQLLSCIAEGADNLIRNIGTEIFVSSMRPEAKNL